MKRAIWLAGLSCFLVLGLHGQDSAVVDSLKESVVLGLEKPGDLNTASEATQGEEVVDGPTDIFSWINSNTGSILKSLVFLLLTWLILRFAKKILEIIAERNANFRIRIKGVIPVVSFIVWALVIYMIIVKVFAPAKQTTLAATASLGLAFGFAAQDILKNIFAGIIILFDAPFRVGDKIEVGSHYGEVTRIGLRSTKIVTPDDSIVTLPNSDLMNSSVSNANSGEANCQVVAELHLPQGVDTTRVRQIATEAAQVSKYVYLEKPIAVLFFHEVLHDKTYLKMRLKAYVLDIRSEFAFKSDMTELVLKELIKEGILPKHDLLLDNETGHEE